MESVELHQAFSWICDECGKRNFNRAVEYDMPPEELKETKKQLGIESWQDGNFLAAPRVVKCGNCKKEYKTLTG